MIAIIPVVARAVTMAMRGAATSAARTGASRAGGRALATTNFEAVSQAAKSMAQVSAAGAGVVIGFTKLSQTLADSRRRYAQFNSTTAAAFARLDVNRQFRSFGTAGATADSTKTLTAALDRFENRLQPYQVALTNVLNFLATTWLNSMDNVVAAIERIPGVGDAIKAQREEVAAKQREEAQRIRTMLDELASKSPYGKMTRPPMGDL